MATFEKKNSKLLKEFTIEIYFCLKKFKFFIYFLSVCHFYVVALLINININSFFFILNL